MFLMIVSYSQLFRKLFRHIIYGNIKTRYNVFRKYANDVFGEYDFMVQKLLKSYTINPMVGMTVAVAVSIEEASK